MPKPTEFWRRGAGALGAGLLVALASCQKLGGFRDFSYRNDDASVACKSETDCPGGVCVFGFCRSPCTTDATCVDGLLCLRDAGRSGCRLSAELGCSQVGEACSQSSSLTCALDHSCRPACNEAEDCGIDEQTCLSGTCVGKHEPGSKWLDCETGRSCGGELGQDIISCNETSVGASVLDSCTSPALCEQGRVEGRCASASCTPGATRCRDKAVERCDDDGSGFSLELGPCASDALCELTRGQKQATECIAPRCAADEVRCRKSGVARCAADLTGFVDEPCDADQEQCSPDGTCIDLAVDATEVSRSQYAEFVADAMKPSPPAACAAKTSYAADAACLAGSDVCQPTGACGDDPQVCVDWCDAFQYCAWKGQHLCGRIGGGPVPFTDFADPVRSEWSNACSSGGEFAFPYGDDTVNMNCQGAIRANQTGNRTVASGSLKNCRSPESNYAALLDLSGNAAEWDDSCDKAATGTKSGPSDQCHARGGSFISVNAELACAADLTLRRDATSASVGFRCCGRAP